ncbi:hypothetical protein BDB00DRAFT_788955 [Zychaea mexicana]|uniref:uncharacterized protein n=1 Tax=Zychaea mexicana TaxID=64656 RepID=UPI0022FE69E4|nr:uncharacterized protein BDB00DRAFT_788955 [Zychaea mexicana]KAI9492168.1 hypothetical protein BDB00DRAFT_788955 [Zychaea mexicana]
MGKEDKKRKSKSQDKDRKEKKKQKTSKHSHKHSSNIDNTSVTKSASPVVVAKTTTINTYSSFSEIVTQLYLHLAPIWAENATEGVIEQLNAFLMKFVPQLDGIVLAHSNLEFLTDKGKILYDSPFCHFFVRVKFLVWKPRKGTKLVGRINLQSQDHIGLLIYGTFNASIPSKSIPTDVYEWRASEIEAEDHAAQDDNDDEDESKEDDDDDEVGPTATSTEERKPSQYGEWVNKTTGVPVGGDDGTVEFNVVDIIEANDILTVTGSL